MKLSVMICAICLLTGCNLLWHEMTPEERSAYDAQKASEAAAESKRQSEILVEASNIPRCVKPEDCSRMWAAARAWVSQNIAWKIQTMSDGFLETYNPTEHSNRVSARVVQTPIDSEAYEFVISFGCRNMFGCPPGESFLRADFNKSVRSVVKIGSK